jgi:hypothetical protein
MAYSSVGLLIYLIYRKMFPVQDLHVSTWEAMQSSTYFKSSFIPGWHKRLWSSCLILRVYQVWSAASLILRVYQVWPAAVKRDLISWSSWAINLLAHLLVLFHSWLAQVLDFTFLATLSCLLPVFRQSPRYGKLQSSKKDLIYGHSEPGLKRIGGHW